jgi:tetraacyldisaccharide 4'-kinase
MYGFSDHHHFSEKRHLDIKNKSLERSSLPLRRIICDYRKNTSDQLFILPIKVKEQFKKTIINYVGTSTRDGRLSIK